MNDESRHVPATLQQALAPEWLAHALAPVSGGAAIDALELVDDIRGMASKLRIRVRFANAPDRVHAFCLKAFFDAADAASAGGETTIREARFYLELAPQTDMRVPGCANALIDAHAGRGILILDDLIAAGARFCSAREAFSTAQCAQSLEQIARLHAAARLLPGAPWLPCRIERLATSPRFTVEQVQPLLDDPRGDGLPMRTRSATLLFAGIKALAKRNATRAQTLLHGDCHPNNLYWTADGPGFADWQLVQRGNWALDVAYHIAAVLPVTRAERDERALLDHYLDALRAVGGDAPDRETAWDDYRAAQIYGFFHWAITRRVAADITREMTQRLGAGVTRHESYRLLGL
jgi:hypothetical protein